MVKQNWATAKNFARGKPQYTAPTQRELDRYIEEGVEILAMCTAEPLWLIVTSVNGGVITAVINVHPANTAEHGLKYRDTVSIKDECILDFK